MSSRTKMRSRERVSGFLGAPRGKELPLDLQGREDRGIQRRRHASPGSQGHPVSGYRDRR
jgi:hypothetical protein